jgi:ribosome-associated heat shock protein Hsp15
MPEERQRVDKFLWFARFARTRTLAQKLVTAGHVRINKRKTDNAAASVAIGDVLTLAIGNSVRVIRITALAARRGGAAEARLLYEDLAQPTTTRSSGESEHP